MVAKNDITGDLISSKETTDRYRDGWDRIFGKKTPQHCMCSACKDGVIHDSDCSVHNEPAYPAGPCDCSKKDIK